MASEKWNDVSEHRNRQWDKLLQKMLEQIERLFYRNAILLTYFEFWLE